MSPLRVLLACLFLPACASAVERSTVADESRTVATVDAGVPDAAPEASPVVADAGAPDVVESIEASDPIEAAPPTVDAGPDAPPPTLGNSCTRQPAQSWCTGTGAFQLYSCGADGGPWCPCGALPIGTMDGQSLCCIDPTQC